MVPRYLTFALLLTSYMAGAQWTGGPLTITASPLFGQVPHGASAFRGGPPPNDQCQNAVITVLPQNGSATITGTNLGATDTEDFGNPNVWEAFTIDTCSTVTVSYCGTDPVHTLVYSILIIGCPGEVSIQNSGTSTCTDGNTVITYANLAAGTYYIPVLLFAGAAEGPYTITLTSDVCEFPPLNERCVDAQQVLVVDDCAAGAVGGNNSLAVQNGSDPQCAPSNSVVQDVWYSFNSGVETQVMIELDPGTTSDLGISVQDACGMGGTVVLCGTGDVEYALGVDPFTEYKVRVFSNNDFGTGGAFTICVRRVPPACDGGDIALSGGSTSAQLCAGLDPSVLLTSTSTAGLNYSYLLANANDTVLAVFEGPQLITDTLALGLYHVWGYSYSGELLAAVGGPVDSVSTDAGCASLSNGPVTLSVEICQAVAEATASGNMAWVAEDGRIRVRMDRDHPNVQCAVFDAQGRCLMKQNADFSAGGVMEVGSASLPVGYYVLVISADATFLRKPLIAH